jgi:eukaryotic-like serine/threonine-protein kinase
MKRFLRGLGIFLALVGVGIVSALAVVALLLRQEEVRVPDLTGQDIVTAIETLTMQGLQLKVERRESHSTLPKDAIITQIPAPGSGIKKGRQVRVVVSQGPSEMQAPKLVGEYYRKAEIMIRQAGFSPGNLSRVSSESVERDIVISQAPSEGSQVSKGGVISMLVSSGKKVPVLVTPKLIGKKAEEAVRIVDRAGLQHRIVYKTSGSRLTTAERVVVNQKPGAGYPVPSDGTVDIFVSK